MTKPYESRDVFLSYASEDKTCADILCATLKAGGLSVWIDSVESKAGDEVLRMLNSAILACKCLVPLVTPFYLEKKWTMIELGAAINSGMAVVPVLQGISTEEVKRRCPVMTAIVMYPVENDVVVLRERVADCAGNWKEPQRSQIARRTLQTIEEYKESYQKAKLIGDMRRCQFIEMEIRDLWNILGQMETEYGH